MKCLVEECLRKVHACGLCAAHYMRGRRSNPVQEMPYRAPRRRKFQAETWWRWWEERQEDRRTKILREGIRQMRGLLACREPPRPR